LFHHSTAAETSALLEILAPFAAPEFTCMSYLMTQVFPASTEILENVRFGALKEEVGDQQLV